MKGIELAARRAALGMTQTDLARVLGVQQEAISRWETGLRSPRDPGDVQEAIERLEGIQDALIDELCEVGEHSSSVLDSPTVVFRVFASDEDYWSADRRAERERIPAALHRSSAVWAARILAEEWDICARLSLAP